MLTFDLNFLLGAMGLASAVWAVAVTLFASSSGTGRRDTALAEVIDAFGLLLMDRAKRLRERQMGTEASDGTR